jgi:hypothetical protein
VDNATRTWKDPDGRTRYHGQTSQGRQTNANLDAQALAAARKALDAGAAGLAYYYGAEVQALPKAQRDGVRRAALAKLALCVRFVDDEVLTERHRYSEDLAQAAKAPRQVDPGRKGSR